MIEINIYLIMILHTNLDLTAALTGYPAHIRPGHNWATRGPRALHHLLLLDLVVDHVAARKLRFDVINCNPHLYHENHHVVDEV